MPEPDGIKVCELRKLYTPLQIWLGIYFGGPLAAIYFLINNFVSLNKIRSAQFTFFLGGAVSTLTYVYLLLISDLHPVLLIPSLQLMPQTLVLTYFDAVGASNHAYQAFIPFFYLIPAMLLVRYKQMNDVKTLGAPGYDFYPFKCILLPTLLSLCLYLLPALILRA